VDRLIVEFGTREKVRFRIVWNDQAPDTVREVVLFPYAHRMITRWCREKVSAEEVADRLNGLGVLTKYQTRWTPKNVWRQLGRMKPKEHHENGTY
jgi:hypothetical protein